MDIDIEKLTIGQINEIARLAGCTRRPTKKRVAPSGRAVVVIDRGWIVAGDLSRAENGDLRVSDALHVFKWTGIGFAKMLTEWKTDKVDLRPLPYPVEVPFDSVIFRVPVEAGWGKR